MSVAMSSAKPTPTAYPPRASTMATKRPNPKQSQFQFKHGQRHHTFHAEKAPYPLCYDRTILELEALDTRFTKQVLDGSVSLIKWKDSPQGPPQNCLDLGCGTGSWVLEAATEFVDCSFCGFDLVDVQRPLIHLEESIRSRIRWQHGNFLTTKLPFEDEEFDYVHIHCIAKGIPENKWGQIFEEVARVLRPGGAIEITEEDIIFPKLPAWFTAPLRLRAGRGVSVHLPNGARPQLKQSSTNTDDHALLESLYKSVFESRFINMRPTAVLPSYLTTYFRHVTLGPLVNFPMPPLPPLQPMPQQLTTNYALDLLGDADPRASVLHQHGSDKSSPLRNTRKPSSSFSSTVSSSSNALYESQPPLFTTSDSSSSTSAPQAISRKCTVDNSLQNDSNLFPVEGLKALSERSLAMHLFRSYQSVLACQEAMWEELNDRLRNKRSELAPYGWDDDEELEELKSRKKFEKLVQRYETDMHSRVSLWCSLVGAGWSFPPREPLSKAELIEEERIRQGMIEARKLATEDDANIPCRTARALTGYKML